MKHAHHMAKITLYALERKVKTPFMLVIIIFLGVLDLIACGVSRKLGGHEIASFLTSATQSLMIIKHGGLFLLSSPGGRGGGGRRYCVNEVTSLAC